jgi:hypothetical protein
LLAVPWWHLSVAGNAAPAALYVTAIALALLGLRLAAGFLQARFGHLDIDKMRGLARPMPRFATLLTLLMMAVMGLPLFGVFSGFMALLLGPSSFGAAGLAGVVVLWFLASCNDSSSVRLEWRCCIATSPGLRSVRWRSSSLFWRQAPSRRPMDSGSAMGRRCRGFRGGDPMRALESFPYTGSRRAEPRAPVKPAGDIIPPSGRTPRPSPSTISKAPSCVVT